MKTPIYSDDKTIDDSNVLSKHIISILSKGNIQDINNKITFAKHGIYIFPQYQEKRYIINGFAEEIFWKLTNRLYALLHDCGSVILGYFLEEVQNDGKQNLKPFPIVDGVQKKEIERANTFIENIEILRHLEQHNMKPDSSIDKSKETKCKKLFKNISKKERPETDEEWEKCILWIWDNCKNLDEILRQRLEHVEERTNDIQKDCLLGGYYRCIDVRFGNLMENIVCEVFRMKHKEYNKMYVRAQVTKYKKDIINKTIELLKSSDMRVDPYKAVLQAAQYYIN